MCILLKAAQILREMLVGIRRSRQQARSPS
jgi:hypothetical protein